MPERQDNDRRLQDRERERESDWDRDRRERQMGSGSRDREREYSGYQGGGQRDDEGEYSRGGREQQPYGRESQWGSPSWGREDSGRESYGQRGYGREEQFGRQQRYGGGLMSQSDREDYSQRYGGGGSSDRGDWQYRGQDRGAEGQWRSSQGGDRSRYDRSTSGSSTSGSSMSGSMFGGGIGTFGGGLGDYGERGRYSGRGPKGYQRSDERIKEDVCDRLTQHPEIDASEIEVRVSNGEVTLTGSVDERNAKRIAEDAVENIHGVREVHNQLRVQQNQGHGQQGQQTGVGQTSSATQTSPSARKA